MPHINLEHTAETAAKHDMAAITDALFEAALASGLFPNPAAVKVRTTEIANLRMGSEPQSLAHITVSLFAGRSTEDKRALAEGLLATLAEHLPEVGSLSVDMRDIDKDTYVKRVL